MTGLPVTGLTPTARRALEIVRDAPGIRPREFAVSLWGFDHPGWNRVGKAGPYGSTTGTGLLLSAGGYLGKLRKRGLLAARIDDDYGVGYALSQAGRDALSANANRATPVGGSATVDGG